jgi:hypothetical protein
VIDAVEVEEVIDRQWLFERILRPRRAAKRQDEA